MAVQETLITEVRMRDQDFKRGAADVAKASSQMQTALDSNRTAAFRFGSAIGGAMRAGAIAIGAAGVAMIGLGVASSKAAAEFDTFERMLGGALGSMEKGRQVMAGLEDYAQKSAFSLEALTRASTQLAAGGLSIARFLPTIEKFALVISGVDPTGLEQVAGALLRAKGGAFGEAMEVFRRAGVGASDFRGAGIDVGKDGQVKATADEFFNALEQLVQGRISNMADAISGGAENKISNAGDAIAKAFRQVGQAVNAVFLPKVEAFSSAVSDLADSGAIKAITDSFLGLASAFTGSEASLEEAVWGAAKALYAIPYIIGTINGGIKQMLFGGLSPLRLVDKVMGGDGSGSRIGGAFGDTYTAVPFAEFDSIREAAAMRKKLAAKRGEKAATALDKVAAAETGSITPAADSPATSEVAKNTRQLVQLQERQNRLQEQILGGGAIGRGAVSAVGIGRALGSRGSSLGADVENAAMQFAKSIIREALGQIAQGANVGTLQAGRR